MYSAVDLLLAGLAAAAAGAVNSLAGGGTLITFPALIALGVPPVVANLTNTVALCPGYVGGTLAQRRDLQGQTRRLWTLIPAGVVGGVVGGLLLLGTSEESFRALVPWLILSASALLAVQDPVRAWLVRRLGTAHGAKLERLTWLPVMAASVYGGYFGAGLGVILLAALGLTLAESLTRLNALKLFISFGANVAAAFCFVLSGKVIWSLALVMAIGALIGGTVGGRFAGRIRPVALRWLVVSIGVIVSVVHFARG